MLAIARIYEKEESAREAGRLLVEGGFADANVHVVSPDPTGSSPASTVADALRAGNAMREYVDVCSDALSAGRSVVVVSLAFGQGRLATNIMQSCGPVDTHLLQPPPEAELEIDAGTPFSRLFFLPLLTDVATPLSELLGWETKSKRSFFMSRFLGSPLTDSDWTFSEVFGIKIRSSSSTPLSSMMGMPTLTRTPSGDDYRRSFGIPLLSKNPTPLSSLFGMPLLTKNATPLSSFLGIGTLAR